LPWHKAVEESGFAIFPEVFSRGEIARLIEEISHAEFKRSRAGARHVLAHPAVEAFARDSRLLTLAQAVLGSKVLPFKATFFDKSSDANWLVPWHQDTALPLRERRETPGWGPWSVKEGIVYAHAPAGALDLVLALRIHLDSSTARNGPLRVLPETHSLGVLTDGELQELAARIPAATCLVPQGGVLAMRPLLVHASSKSLAGMLRRVLHIEYAPSLKVAEGLELALA
jgi:ectoine hydroxylase-related dioxygenase (phytanoyl-CoA dioxygenase family)